MRGESESAVLEGARGDFIERDAFLHLLIGFEHWGNWIDRQVSATATTDATPDNDVVDALVGVLSLRALAEAPAACGTATLATNQLPTPLSWPRDWLR